MRGTMQEETPLIVSITEGLAVLVVFASIVAAALLFFAPQVFDLM